MSYSRIHINYNYYLTTSEDFVCNASTELPVRHRIQLLEVNTFAVADIAKICEAAINEAQLPHPPIIVEVLFILEVLIFIVAVIGILVLRFILPILLVVDSIHLKLLFTQAFELHIVPVSLRLYMCN